MFKSSSFKKSAFAKVVILGENAVGKTSVRKNYLGQGFRSEHLMTIGTDFSQKIVTIGENRQFDLQIWDIASDLNYEKIRRQKYLRKASGALLVFDISRYETFLRLNYWLRELFIANPKSKIPLLIVGNKHDLERDREINEEDIEKFVHHLRNDKSIKSTWIEYIETSAKTGYNVEKAFQKITEAIIHNL